MEKLRGFEVAKGWEDKNINLPIRKTARSAGYDVEAAEDLDIPPFKPGDKPTLVHTGLKAYCQDDEWYMLANRSSHPGKKKLVLLMLIIMEILIMMVNLCMHIIILVQKHIM